MNNTILECRNITKVYSGTRALDEVSFGIKKAHIHALVGENGAGKSTLSNIISGLQKQTSGDILFENELVSIKNTTHAKSLGITIMTQEVDYCPNLTVAGNVFLGEEVTKRGILYWDHMNAETQKILDRMGVSFKATDKAKYLSTSQKQQMQLARILHSKAKLIIMDEPTSSLTENEVKVLFNILKSIQSDELSIIYISHHMEEIFEIADTVTVLRDGKMIGTKPISDTSMEEVINMIIGNKQKFSRIERLKPFEENKVLEVKELSLRKQFSNISFHLRKGEVLGIFGLRGSGTDELIQALFGVKKVDAGEILVNGKKKGMSIRKSIESKMVFIPSNRREEGIIKTMSVRDNMAVGSLDEISRLGVIDFKKATKSAQEMVSKLQVACKGINQRISHLSGGNQQKAIVARSILMNAEILLIFNPTRGIDVGAKAEIYRLIRQLSEDGLSVVITSSEISDILSVCDTVKVMRKGKMEAEFEGSQISEEKILHAALSS